MAGPSTFARHIAGGIVREMWPDEALQEELLSEDAVMGMAKKETDWSTGVYHWPLGWGGNQGIGRTFAGAKQYKSAAQQDDFQLTTREMFAALSLEGKLLRAAEYGKKNILVDPLKREGEAALERMKRRFYKATHGDGVGVLGRITSGSNVATTSVTLTDANDLKNFEKDRPVQTESTGATGGTLNDSGAVGIVASVGTYDSPTVTLTVAWSTAFPSVAAGHYIVGYEQYDNDYFYGLAAFLPSHSGSPGTFLTCARNDNPEWFAGSCMSGANMSLFQRAKTAARRLTDRGEKPDTYFTSTRNFEKFEFENKPELVKFPGEDMGKMKLGISYMGSVIQGPRGPLKIIPLPWMPDTIERCGKVDTLCFGSIGPLIHWDDGNGPRDLRTEDGTDNRELRAVSDPAFLVKRPGAWMRVAV